MADMADHMGHDFSRVSIQARPAQEDVYEQEADHVAERVMRMPEPQQGLPAGRVRPGSGEAAGVPPIVHDVLRSPGQPLDRATRDFMEPRFGLDLSGVRVHADPKAADSAQTLNALAYTVGRDVVFGAGQYTTDSNEGRKLVAHELTHVVQQGFTAQAVQRRPKKPKAKLTTNTKLVYAEIKKRNPDLAKLITPGSLDPIRPKEPPAIKAGPMQNKEIHVWKVNVLASRAFGSQVGLGPETRTKVKGVTQVTHSIQLFWALPIAPDPEFSSLTSSANQAFTLTAAEALYHELLHARIIMERDPHWTGPHTQVFNDYTAMIKLADSPAVDKERQALKQAIGDIAQGATDVTAEQDRLYEFLVHEKYDADTEGKAFGRAYPNALIAEKYSVVVARGFGLGDPKFKGIQDKVAAAAEALFDKLDQAAQSSTPATPNTPSTPGTTGSPPE